MGRKSREKRERKLAESGLVGPQANQVVRQQSFTAIAEKFSGPIPPPTILSQYDQIVPGAAERILQMAERQAAHRIGLESQVITSDIKKSERGQVFGLIVAVGGLTAALLLGLTGHEMTGGLIAGVDLVSLAGVFVFGRRKKEKRLDQAKKND